MWPIRCVVPVAGFFSGFSSICPFASARHITICLLHVLFAISFTSSQRCVLSPTLYLLCGAYAEIMRIGILDFPRPRITLRNRLLCRDIGVTCCAMRPCISITTPTSRPASSSCLVAESVITRYSSRLYSLSCGMCVSCNAAMCTFLFVRFLIMSFRTAG